MKILQNEIKCLSCGDQIYSAHRHDFKKCSCGNVFVDGGMEYLRRGGSGFEDKSISISDKLFKCFEKALIWSKENNRNDLGTICTIFRECRDNGFDLTVGDK